MCMEQVNLFGLAKEILEPTGSGLPVAQAWSASLTALLLESLTHKPDKLKLAPELRLMVLPDAGKVPRLQICPASADAMIVC